MKVVTGPDGSQIPYSVIKGHSDWPKLLLIAGVHGDEIEGVAALQSLEYTPGAGPLTIVPVANPLALRAGTRLYSPDGNDLNRSFPGCPDGPPAERLANFLFKQFVVGQDGILSMHGWSRESEVVPYVEYPDDDSPAGQKSKELAFSLGLKFAQPYKWEPGLLVKAAFELGIACVETEIGGFGAISEDGQALSRLVIHRFLDYWQKGSAREPVQLIRHIGLQSTSPGLMRLFVKLGATVTKGQTVGTVSALDGTVLEELISPEDGFVGVLRRFAVVNRGDLIAQIFSRIN